MLIIKTNIVTWKFESFSNLIKFFSGVLHKFPEEFRPERPFEFASIHNISAENANANELNEYKKEIRRVLDWAASEIETEVGKEAELFKKLQQRQTEYGPSLV